MVRLLVWDWEVIRNACFPFRPNDEIPGVDALVQYHSKLAPAISSGFRYEGAYRGASRTYARRYLNTSESDPYELDEVFWS